MEAAGLDALVIGAKGHWWTGRGYMRYLADFHLWGHDALIVVPRDGEPSAVVTSPGVAAMIRRRGWIERCHGDMRILPTATRLVSELGLSAGRLGLVGARWVIPAGLTEGLAEQLPRASFERVDALADAVRMVKSELEIEQNRETWRLAQAAMERFEQVLAPGVPARELAAAAAEVALAGGARDILMLMGDRSELYAPPTPEPLNCDDMVRFHMEIAGESGHWCELTSTFAFRPLTETEDRLIAAELRAAEQIRAAARPGATLEQLAGIFEATLEQDGFTRTRELASHFDFHGQGQDVIEDPCFAEDLPIAGLATEPLVSGTVLSYHPHRNVDADVSWAPGVSDSLLITDDGGEWLSADWRHSWREGKR
jgi:Xaa-Pro dipeptidase